MGTSPVFKLKLPGKVGCGRNRPFLIYAFAISLSILLNYAVPSHGWAKPSEVSVRGKVGNFTDRYVFLETENGKIIIPKKNVADQNLRPGMEIEVKINALELLQYNNPKLDLWKPAETKQ